jgi:hypothetical protein
MSPHDNDRDLVAVLESLRPGPDSEFVRELDARAAEGFPRALPDGAPAPRRLRDRLAGLRWSRTIAPAGALAVLAIAIATAAVSITETDGGESDPGGDFGLLSLQQGVDDSSAPAEAPESAPPVSAGRSAAGQSAAGRGAAGQSAGLSEFSAGSVSSSAGAASSRNREIERAAQVVLEAEPSEVREASGRVFAVVRDHDGIVLRSAVRDRGDGDSIASFDLLIPSGELDEALAELSEIATVRSRSDSTADVTTPTVSLEQRLRAVRSDIDRLLTERAEAESEVDREAIERRLRTERARASYIRSRLDVLEERVRFSRVSLRIVSTDGAEGDGAWGVDDAVDDAGRILGVAAGVTLIGLAVLAPLALIGLLLWAGHRAWTRRARERALG